MREARVQFYCSADGEYRWRMRSPNGRIICDSAEGYKSKKGCINGYEAVAKAFKGKPKLVMWDE